jgi:hypothetical protein
MPGLVPGIHAFGSASKKGVDGRDTPGHDGGEVLPKPRFERVAAGQS